jgi:RNA polymerase sigma factor (TIGR02999 family)
MTHRRSGRDAGPATNLLARWRSGDGAARDALLDLLYDELRRIAELQLRGERVVTIQATGLVHEVYLRLIGQRSLPATDRHEFLMFVARMMRRVLVDLARARRALKRGGGHTTMALPADDQLALEPELDLVRLDEALTELGELDPEQARLVELRYFAGLSIEDTAATLGVSPATVKREWATARVWLRRELQADSR